MESSRVFEASKSCHFGKSGLETQCQELEGSMPNAFFPSTDHLAAPHWDSAAGTHHPNHRRPKNPSAPTKGAFSRSSNHPKSRSRGNALGNPFLCTTRNRRLAYPLWHPCSGIATSCSQILNDLSDVCWAMKTGPNIQYLHRAFQNLGIMLRLRTPLGKFSSEYTTNQKETNQMNLKEKYHTARMLSLLDVLGIYNKQV